MLKCSELGWTCIPLVVESYGAWGREAVQAFSRLASHLATRTNTPKSKQGQGCSKHYGLYGQSRTGFWPEHKLLLKKLFETFIAAGMNLLQI
jgi:hypothetical protein